MRLIIIRHAETEANRDGTNQGWTDSPLTAVGEEQAACLARVLGTTRIDHIYTSDLARCVATLAPFRAAHPDILVDETKELREQDIGTFEGTEYGSIMKAAKELGESIYEFKRGQGESIHERNERVTAFVDGLLEQYHGEQTTICIFTHGGPAIDILLHLLKEVQEHYSYFQHGNAHRSEIEVDEHVRLLKLNVPCTE